MKIKIIEKGYESLNGYFGTILFENGVSVSDVSLVDSNQIAAVLSIVDAETGKAVGQAQLSFDNWGRGQPTERLLTRAEMKRLGASADAKQPVEVEQSTPAKAEDEGKKVYTQEELEAIADAKGIAGLRSIGDPLDAKAKSIPALITEILRAQQRKDFSPKVAG